MLDFSKNQQTPFFNQPARKTEKLFGIEIEVENCILATIPAGALTYWTTVGDSSLKENGVEFVSRILHLHEVKEALNQVYNKVPFLLNKEATFGPRTSIHIHSDVTWMEDLTQLSPLIFMYLLCEDLMYKFVEPHRRKNIFCVKTKETKYLRRQLVAQSLNLEGLFKYAGFNLRSLFDHGTVEFRMLEGTYDIQKILTWIDFITAIQDYAKTAESGLSFKREIKNPDRARSIIYPLYRDHFNEEEIEKSIQAGLEYFRYLYCEPISSKVTQLFLDEGFFSSKFYSKNYVRLSK